MPANRLSLHVTDAYREVIIGLRDRTQALVRANWSRLDPTDLDGTYPLPLFTAAITVAQGQAAQTSAAYLAAFLTSETGQPQQATPIETRAYVGTSRIGSPLRDALRSPLIGVKAALAQGKPMDQALRAGLVRAVRTAGLEVDHVARQPILDAVRTDDRFDGWRRAVAGTCGACLSLAGSLNHDMWFEAHPGCECAVEPQVSGLGNIRPDGAALFAAMTPEGQDQAFGPRAAQAVRDGLPIERLVKRQPQETTTPFITQAPVPEKS